MRVTVNAILARGQTSGYGDNEMRSNIRRLLIMSGLLLCWIPAHAYIDPGTGSALIGGVVAAFAAIVAFTKLYWHRFKLYWHRFIGLFSRKKNEERSPQEKHDTSEQ